MMLITAIILSVIWLLFYVHGKKALQTGKIYFIFLFFMILPSWLQPDWMLFWIETEVNYFYIIIFGLLLMSGFYPWYIFDKYITRHKVRFEINPKKIKRLKVWFTVIIILSLYSIVYLLPYAIMGMILGAAETRNIIKTGSLLPASIFTTLAVGFAALNIYCILFFYVSSLSPELKKYRFWLLLSSLSYIVASSAVTGRDGLVVLPVFFLVFYLLFKSSYSFALQRVLKKSIIIMVIIMGVLMSIITASRFYANEDNDELFIGTLGYISQQPYVFNTTIEKQNDFHGFELRFPLVNRIIGIPEHKISRSWGFETQFGTMYAEFYSIYGWWTLFFMAILFCTYYSFTIRYLLTKKKIWGAVLMFTVYLYIMITGLFYCRAGSNTLINVFYILLSVGPLFVRNYLKIKK